MTYCVGDPSQERLNELFEYRDGKLYNKTKRNSRARKGAESGTLVATGYKITAIDGRKRRVHRLIWIMHNGDIPEKKFIDHRNGIRDDNHIENLRVVTNQQNCWNRHTTTKGYFWDKAMQKWRAYIKKDGVQKHLGYFDEDDEAGAAEAYLVAKKKYHIIEEM